MLSLRYSNNYIILPIKFTNPKLNITEDNGSFNYVTKLLAQIDKNRIYTKIKMGEPKKDIIIFLSMEDLYFGILKDYCPKEAISEYNPYFSNTFEINNSVSFPISDLFQAKIGNDTISFYNDSKLKEKLEITFDFLIANKTQNDNDDFIPDSYCGKLGLLKKYFYPYLYSNFIDNLKKEKKIINSYQWGIFFFDKEKSYNIDEEIQKEYDGFYIVGLTKNDYLNFFRTNDITSVYQSMTKSSNIGGKFDKIYYIYSKEEIVCHNELNFEINIDHNYILCSKDYYDNIKKHYFKEYLENNICQELYSFLYIGSRQYMIICNSTIKESLKNFPNIYFVHKELNFTFNLDYKDLFIEINDKIYFLAIYREGYSIIWNFGSLLIKKYSFMFDQDSKSLYFIRLKKYENYPIEPNKGTTDNSTDNSTDNKDVPKEEDKKSFWSKYKEYILFGGLFIFLIIGAILGYIFGRKIWEKHRKTRANELDDNYEYSKDNSDDKLSKIIN